jgi:hypothetical protein
MVYEGFQIRTRVDWNETRNKMKAAAELERAAQEIAKLQDALRSRDALLQTLEARCQEQVRPFANSKP